MEVYRLIKKKYASNPLDTEGSKRFGGRWNTKGKGLLYTSDTVSLAALEILVHVHLSAVLNAYVCITIDLPDNAIMLLEDNALPDNWRSDPPPLSTMSIGDEWMQIQSSLALSVPSTLITKQRNYLINPLHPDFKKLHKSVVLEDFIFDSRLIRE